MGRTWIGASLIAVILPALAWGDGAVERRSSTTPARSDRATRVEMRVPGRKASIGETLAVRVRISRAANVASVPFHVVYDPKVVEFDSAEEAEYLKQGGAKTAFFATAMSAPGEIVVGLSRLGGAEGARGSGELCVLRFRVIASGDAGLAFRDASVKDPGNRLVASAFEAARVRVR